MSNNEKFSRGAATVLLFVMIAAFVLAAFGVFSGDNSTSENNKPSISSVLESSSDGGTPPDASTTPEVPDDSSSSVVEPPDDSSSGEVEGAPATSISLSPMAFNLFSTPERGAYYALETSKTYEFDIALDNASHSVSSQNLTVSLGGSGTLYFGTKQLTSDGLSQFTAMAEHPMSGMVDKFISATVTNGILRIQADI